MLINFFLMPMPSMLSKIDDIRMAAADGTKHHGNRHPPAAEITSLFNSHEEPHHRNTPSLLETTTSDDERPIPQDLATTQMHALFGQKNASQQWPECKVRTKSEPMSIDLGPARPHQRHALIDDLQLCAIPL